MTITQPIQSLVQAALQESREKEIDPNEPKISITTRASKATFVYERMRNSVDYKEEHLVRRNAIERILRRMLASDNREDLAENLINELIHARYLPNDIIPQRKIGELEKIFEKYFALLGLAPLKDIHNTQSLSSWTLGIMATEIDEFLVPPHLMHASINTMYEYMQSKLHIEDEISLQERHKQVYIASSRSLYKNDEDTLKYHLFITYYPEWPSADKNLIKKIGAHLQDIRSQIDTDLNHPLKEKLTTTFRKHVGYFSVLSEIISHNPGNAWSDLHIPNQFETRIQEICKKKYLESRAALHRGITRSIIYLVLTKFLIAIILEIPIEYFILQDFDYIPLLINLIFPPSLLAVIALSTKLPDDENTKQMIAGISNIIEGKGDIIQMRKTKQRGFIMQTIFVLSYGILFLLSFGVLIYILQLLNFSIIGILIFLFFLSLVSLFAYRIRLTNQELIVTPPKKGIIRGLWSFFTIPVLHAGKWMSTRFAKINVFIFVLDFVIEAPFKAFIKIIEEWMNYVHEKKEEI
ncbi:hypothetical protein CL632_02575 [bacterium]|jgi:hypothetical protein|nr:hypothetical protein [bacterium]MDP6756534.1 hypothetical protein [Patescibacteria group bacterium]